MLKFVLVSMVTIGGSMFSFKLSARPPNAALVPVVLESTPSGERSWDIFSRLMQDRVILLNSPINEQVDAVIMAQLLYLDTEDPEADISLYINSPGGSIYSGMAIYDTMNLVKADVCTYGIGICASMAAFLLAAGAEGKRYSLPNATIMIHQPRGGAQGQATDIEIQAEEILRLKKRMIEILSQQTGQDLEQVRADMERDNYMTAEEAVKYGIVDKIFEPNP